MARRLPLTGWEIVLVVLILAAGAWSATLSPYYLSLDQIFYSTRQFVIPGLLALGLTIDRRHRRDRHLARLDRRGRHRGPVEALRGRRADRAGRSPIVVLIGALLGTFNGVLVAGWRLPSLAVTLGTMGAYRGLAFIIGSETGYTDFTRHLSLWSAPSLFWRDRAGLASCSSSARRSPSAS